MSALDYIYLSIHNAEIFKKTVSETTPNTKLFITMGHVSPWDDENSPPDANSSIASNYDVWSNMIGGKYITGNDIAIVVPRFDWAANTEYAAYDHLNSTLYDGNPFYVLNSDSAVFKCLGNNNGQLSTVEPATYDTTAPFTTADGYIWKFMYQLSSAELLRFTTTTYHPVKTLTGDDGSLQWSVQNNARQGSIETIYVVDGGSGFTNTANIVVSVSGDSASVVAAQVSNISLDGAITSIVVSDPGINFTYANVSISGGGGTGASARAIISPPGGHGSNPLYELGGHQVVIDARLKYDEEGVLPVTNDYRQIALLKNPIDRLTGNIATLAAFSQMTVVTTSGSGLYIQDEIVYQGNNLETASFSGQVVHYDDAINKLYLINTTGTPTASRTLVGKSSFVARTLASVQQPDLVKNSGIILFTKNIPPVARASDQLEVHKILL